jgi:hypothetical protein
MLFRVPTCKGVREHTDASSGSAMCGLPLGKGWSAKAISETVVFNTRPAARFRAPIASPKGRAALPDAEGVSA